jgi:hypothetical protein
MTTCPEILVPGTLCSTNGFCNNTTQGKCICTVPGFSGMGDLRFQDGLDCDVSLPAIQALWALAAIFSFCAVSSSVAQLTLLVQRQGLRTSLNQRLNKIHFGIVLTTFHWFILAIWRLSDIRTTAIGDDVSVTYFSVFTGQIFTVFALTLLYQFYMIHSSLIQRVTRLEKEQSFRRILCVTYIVFSFPWLTALWGYYNPAQVDTVNEVRLLVDALNNSIYAVLAPYAFNPMIKALDESLVQMRNNSEAKFRTIRKNIVRVRRELIVQPLFGAAVKVTFAFWPYLRRKIVYEFPIQIVLWMIMTFALSIFIARQSHTNAGPKATAIRVTSEDDNNKLEKTNDVVVGGATSSQLISIEKRTASPNNLGDEPL